MPKVSVVIPTLNEVSTIKMVLDSLPKDIVDEVLVVDGRSTDGTVELVKSLGYPVYTEEGNGFGAAFATGAKKATGDIVVFINSDYSHDAADIPKFLKKIEEGYDMVMASRYMKGGGSEEDTFVHYIGNRVITFVANLVHGAHFSDILYFYLAAKKEVFDRVETTAEGFEYCIELPIKAHKAGFKITQVPSLERKRAGGKAKVSAFKHGSKIFLSIFNY
ncbi:MAG: glycosyltransferase family 2 protein [Candidatus Nealsonbacteria bacterium]|nr:glycosyltransferase family 2 protein [Candidatus Nealsonbacteria bacterium]